MSHQPDQIIEHPYCRACANPISTDLVLDLGEIPLSGFLLRGAESPHPPIPLQLRWCPRCTLVQLGHTTPRDWLYREGYWYQSGINEAMREELTDVVRAGIEWVGGLSASDNVLDIGANDGTLIRAYHTLGDDQPQTFAVEPAGEFRERLLTCATYVSTDFFPDGTGLFAPAAFRIVTSIACFYDLDDPHAFVAEIARLLAPDGVWILQVQDLRSMLRARAFDCICAEHLEYYSLHAIIQLLSPHGLVVVDVEPRAINGGSLRVTVRHRSQHCQPSRRVRSYLHAEEADGLCLGSSAVFAAFAWAVDQTKHHVLSIIAATLQVGGPVDLYGASTKGNTLLGYWGLGPVFRQAWERSPAKWGLETSSGRIPIVSEEDGRADPPALLVAAIWQFRDQILRREAKYLRAGGRILFPLPWAELVGEHPWK